MIESINLENPDVLSIQVNGDITELDVKQYSQKMKFENRVRSYTGIFISIEKIGSFRLSGLNFLKEHLMKQPQLFKNIEKIALVADDDLLHKMTRLENSMNSNIERRAFYQGDESVAKDWISQ